MNSNSRKTDDHINPSDLAILDDFMDKTSSFHTTELASEIKSTSPEKLLSQLKHTKKIINSLQNKKEPTEQVKNVLSRLEKIEDEVLILKSDITNLLNNA